MVQVEILRHEGFYYHACIIEGNNRIEQLPISLSSSNLSERTRIRTCICPAKVQIEMDIYIHHKKCKTCKREIFRYSIFLFNLEYHLQVCSCSCPSLHCPEAHDFWCTSVKLVISIFRVEYLASPNCRVHSVSNLDIPITLTDQLVQYVDVELLLLDFHFYLEEGRGKTWIISNVHRNLPASFISPFSISISEINLYKCFSIFDCRRQALKTTKTSYYNT